LIDSAPFIPAFPLVGFLLLTFFGKRLGQPKAGWLGSGAVGLSFLATLVVHLGLLSHISEAGNRQHTVHLFDWLSVAGINADAALLVDPLSVTMALFVTGVSMLIHIYSVGYMKDDPRFHQFFAYMNLFVFSMLVLVMADNFVLLFLGWEGVGACSYLLVGFWFERKSAATAAKKAFIVNRIGDVGLLLGMFLLYNAVGTFTFFVDGGAGALQQSEAIAGSTLTAIALLLFVGAVGKSAQLPLFVWLPDAMEGPTPVSALIHAATMVTAGVYLMVRAAPLLDASSTALMTVAVVGALSALFAATVACAQNDIKRVLAYSTMSQLGYMFLAVGVGAYSVGIFHMVTHAFFKALLFMSAGVVIHALADQQDLKKMGSLRRYLPYTYACVIIGGLAISGIPPLSGFWSKDEVLLSAWDENKALWAVGIVTVFLTAYYMSRLVFLAFEGRERWRTASGDNASVGTKAKEEPVADHHGGGDPHESPRVMLIPMFVLAFLSVVAGVLNLPGSSALRNFLEPVLGGLGHHPELATSLEVTLALVSVAVAIAGIAAAWLIGRKSAPWPQSLEPRLLARAWFIDPLYSLIFEKPGAVLARWSAFAIDDRVIDGVVNGSARLVGATGSGLRRLQSGYVRSYALSIAGGTAVILLWVLVRSFS